MGIQVVGLEIASQDRLYLWREEACNDLLRYVVFPERTYEAVSFAEMTRGVFLALSRIRPKAIAINGYSSRDSWAILAWSKVYHCPTILMTESKVDDAPRVGWKERAKGKIVCQFDAALCGGSLHRDYLQQLGMNRDRIFEGYDTVDNDFFWKGAEQARQDPAAYSSFPGLQSPGPFFLASARFIKRKNLDGLLRAYVLFRDRLARNGKGLTLWRLVILGDGAERSALEHLVDSNGIQGVVFPGFRQIDELPIYYGLSSVFIHPAHQEQWGLVVNEAMAAGLPVLVSKCCGCAPDLISEGENGFTFAPGNADSLANLMARISSDQVDLHAMGLRSRDRVKEWGPKRFAEGLYGAFQAALQGSKSSGK
jgi:glycosyltransferase involved in cell wall biosynthesis